MEETKIEDIKVESNEVPETLKYSMEDFAKEYNELCKKMGLRISVFPVWVLNSENEYHLQIKTEITKLG